MKQTWTGHFTYREGYTGIEQELIVPFTIEWDLENDIIDGDCIDDEAKTLFSRPATVRGFIEDGMISFIKQYPAAWSKDQTGQAFIIDDKPAPEIHYSGTWAGDHYEGEWEMTETALTEEGDIEEFYSTGEWRMHQTLS
jgi:hypothetical protein